ncbi:hypothetical protein Tco_1360641 [Tanacetum coccineum]
MIWCGEVGDVEADSSVSNASVQADTFIGALSSLSEASLGISMARILILTDVVANAPLQTELAFGMVHALRRCSKREDNDVEESVELVAAHSPRSLLAALVWEIKVFQRGLWLVWKWRNKVVHATPDSRAISLDEDIFTSIQRSDVPTFLPLLDNDVEESGELVAAHSPRPSISGIKWDN